MIATKTGRSRTPRRDSSRPAAGTATRPCPTPRQPGGRGARPRLSRRGSSRRTGQIATRPCSPHGWQQRWSVLHVWSRSVPLCGSDRDETLFVARLAATVVGPPRLVGIRPARPGGIATRRCPKQLPGRGRGGRSAALVAIRPAVRVRSRRDVARRSDPVGVVGGDAPFVAIRPAVRVRSRRDVARRSDPVGAVGGSAALVAIRPAVRVRSRRDVARRSDPVGAVGRSAALVAIRPAVRMGSRRDVAGAVVVVGLHVWVRIVPLGRWERDEALPGRPFLQVWSRFVPLGGWDRDETWFRTHGWWEPRAVLQVWSRIVPPVRVGSRRDLVRGR